MEEPESAVAVLGATALQAVNGVVLADELELPPDPPAQPVIMPTIVSNAR